MTKATAQAEFTCIDFLRHGECEGGEIFRGSGSDVALTDKGWQQMRNSVQDMAGWDSIVTSPLQRCRRFAIEQSERLAIPFGENANWREIHFGDWEGRLMADIWKESPDLVASYFKDPNQSTPHNPVNGVSQPTCISRSARRHYTNITGLSSRHAGHSDESI